ncbi:hypothetical protein EMCRGX_G026223 [Ephydatia muelleri]
MIKAAVKAPQWHIASYDQGSSQGSSVAYSTMIKAAVKAPQWHIASYDQGSSQGSSVAYSTMIKAAVKAPPVAYSTMIKAANLLYLEKQSLKLLFQLPRSLPGLGTATTSLAGVETATTPLAGLETATAPQTCNTSPNGMHQAFKNELQTSNCCLGYRSICSRKIIWLELTSTNNDPNVVSDSYDAVIKKAAVPLLRKLQFHC